MTTPNLWRLAGNLAGLLVGRACLSVQGVAADVVATLVTTSVDGVEERDAG
jgi:hypothetical protein